MLAQFVEVQSLWGPDGTPRHSTFRERFHRQTGSTFQEQSGWNRKKFAFSFSTPFVKHRIHTLRIIRREDLFDFMGRLSEPYGYIKDQTGICSRNWLPFPGIVSNSMVPPCAATISRAILRPNPIPSTMRCPCRTR